jgi:hypothetical protein
MSGNFTVGLLEILAYLVPGAFTLGALLYIRFPELVTRDLDKVGVQLAFIVCSYIVGHLLTFLSVHYFRVRSLLKWIFKGKTREKRVSYYEDLRKQLYITFGSEITKDDEYYFCLRLVTENQPHSSQTIDRLYAMTLFSRNTSLAFLITAYLSVGRNASSAIVFAILAILFFFRYVQLEATTANTVFRAAYVYFCSKEKQKKGSEGVEPTLI